MNKLLTNSPISSLLFTGRPLAIIWSVVAVYIYSIKSMFFSGFATHIFNKVPKSNITKPAFIDCDSPTSIVMEMLKFSVKTPIKHMPIMSTQRVAISLVTNVLRGVMVAVAFVSKIVFVAVAVSQVWAWSVGVHSARVSASVNLAFWRYFECFHTYIIAHSLRMDEAF